MLQYYSIHVETEEPEYTPANTCVMCHCTHVSERVNYTVVSETFVKGVSKLALATLLRFVLRKKKY